MAPDEVGALIMLLCQQWENMGPLPNDPTKFAAYAGWDIRIVRRLLGRLIELKKVEATQASIQSGRMRGEIAKYIAKVRAAELREAQRREVHFGRTSSEHQPNFSENSQRSSAEVSEKGNKIRGAPTTTAPLPDSDTDSDKKKNNIRAAEAAQIEVVFEAFWLAFPPDRRRGKGKCRDLFFQIANGRHPKRKASADAMLAAVKAGAGIDPNFPPMPETWLNGGRWEDAPRSAPDDVPAPVNGKAWGWWRGIEDRLRAQPADRWRAAVAQHKPNGTWPWWILGAPPGHPECVMPAEVIAEHGFKEIYRGRITHV